MTPRQQLDSFVDKYTPRVASLARAAFAWMRKRFPGATVLVYDNYNALAIGFGSSEKASEAVFSIALYPRWVSLFFLRGAALPDPRRRLIGSGKQVRHIVLDRIEVLEEPAVLALMEAAATRSELPSITAAAGKILIKSIAPKQRPRRPASSL
jgi:hypothetical protein